LRTGLADGRESRNGFSPQRRTGRRSSFARRRCLAGIATLVGDDGRTPDDGRVDPRCQQRPASWCCASRARTDVGATSESSVSWQSSAAESRRRASRRFFREAGLPRADARAWLSWREFLLAHAASIIACDFFTVETLWLGRLYVLFFIEIDTRRVHLAGCSANSDGRRTTQQARQLAWSPAERPRPVRFLSHDRDSKFSRAFDDVFRREAIEIIRTPFRAPNANAFAERWIGTVRRDCLDWLLITSRTQLEHVLRVHVEHHNWHRPHRALDLTAPAPRRRLLLVTSNPTDEIHRYDRLGGLIHEYARAA
jgi:transposase InsO family protein